MIKYISNDIWFICVCGPCDVDVCVNKKMLKLLKKIGIYVHTSSFFLEIVQKN